MCKSNSLIQWQIYRRLHYFETKTHRNTHLQTTLGFQHFFSAIVIIFKYTTSSPTPGPTSKPRSSSPASHLTSASRPATSYIPASSPFPCKCPPFSPTSSESLSTRCCSNSGRILGWCVQPQPRLSYHCNRAGGRPAHQRRVSWGLEFP